MKHEELERPNQEVYRGRPDLPPVWDACIPGVAAIQALALGNAHEDQQKEALRFLIEVVAGSFEPSYRQGDPNATAFAEGRRFNGILIQSILNQDINTLKESRKNKNADKAESSAKRSK